MSNRIGIGIDVFGAGIDSDAQTIYNRIIADGGVSNLTRLNFFVKGLKAIYGDLANVPVCYDAHWIGYKLGSGTGATAGQAAAKLYSLTVAGDAVQTTAASQPLLLAHNGASSDNYWWGSGVANNNVTTPNAAANQITGDIEVIVNVALNDITSAVVFVSKDDTSVQRSYTCQWSNGTLYFGIKVSTGGFSYYTSTVAASATNLVPIWLKYTRIASSGNIEFFTSTNGITYTKLGATVTSPALPIFNSTTILEIGSFALATAGIMKGKIYRATISNSIGGTPVVDFNPATYNAATSQTAWTSATGEVWTINTGTAATGYKGQLVSKTIVMSDGVDDTLSATIAIAGVKSGYWAVKRLANAVKSVSDALVANKFNLYTNVGTGLNIYTATGDLASSGLTLNVLSQFAVVNNGASSSISKNDGTKTTGTLNDNTLTGVKLFNGADGFSNFIINTHLITGIADSNAQQTATYNFMKSINENAF